MAVIEDVNAGGLARGWGVPRYGNIARGVALTVVYRPVIGVIWKGRGRAGVMEKPSRGSCPVHVLWNPANPWIPFVGFKHGPKINVNRRGHASNQNELSGWNAFYENAPVER